MRANLLIVLVYCCTAEPRPFSCNNGCDNSSDGTPEKKPDFTPDDPHEVIKKAFRTLSLRFHPDKNPGDPDATRRFIAIKAAFEELAERAQMWQEDYEDEGEEDAGLRSRRHSKLAERAQMWQEDYAYEDEGEEDAGLLSVVKMGAVVCCLLSVLFWTEPPREQQELAFFFGVLGALGTCLGLRAISQLA